ncbi:hypothetical protein GWI33_015044 [Rhynchophorus ferrugineus]|uniref:Uncharacterized protein n=1 Tax=Rhynchophorus ferrugineus TaxID=354439 RepID=A0A834I3B8_RHYFE|nr:hypothetical protein GWI33_015044 [Rhynchophorus ferrugineus]
MPRYRERDKRRGLLLPLAILARFTTSVPPSHPFPLAVQGQSDAVMGVAAPLSDSGRRCRQKWDPISIRRRSNVVVAAGRKDEVATLANVKRETGDLGDWCESSGAEDYGEEDPFGSRMVETSAPQGSVLPQHFMFLNQMNEGFKPVYRKAGSPTTASTASGGSSLFTIDSILARPRPTTSAVPRPPVFQGHPGGFGFGHIAAASAGFGTASAEFLASISCLENDTRF